MKVLQSFGSWDQETDSWFTNHNPLVPPLWLFLYWRQDKQSATYLICLSLGKLIIEKQKFSKTSSQITQILQTHEILLLWRQGFSIILFCKMQQRYLLCLNLKNKEVSNLDVLIGLLAPQSNLYLQQNRGNFVTNAKKWKFSLVSITSWLWTNCQAYQCIAIVAIS